MANPPRVLIVDDSDSIRKTMQLVLAHKGYEVGTAPNGETAVEHIREHRYDLIFLDVKMPVMDGVETYKRIKGLRPDAAVMMMTAYAVEDLVADAVREGARGVVYKPLDMDRVIGLIETARHEHEQALILIVDDEPGTCTTLKNVLVESGYDVGVAATGEEAVELAQARPRDVYFIDMKLPTMNGLETHLALQKVHPEAVSVLITGYREKMADLVAAALDHRAYACLYKPLDMDRLLALIEDIQRRKSNNEARA